MASLLAELFYHFIGTLHRVSMASSWHVNFFCMLQYTL